MNRNPHADPPGDRKADTRSRDAMRLRLERELAVAGDVTRPPPPISDHEMLHRIGRGAYGDVWLARSTLGTLRAVKVVYRARFEDDHPYEREFNGIVNYEPISRTHDGLVQVLHVGRSDEAGCFYYVMELADAAQPRGEDGGSKIADGESHSRTRSHPPSSILDPQKYIPRTLRSELARHQRLPPVDAARLVLHLAGALGHLHTHGLVHRDIKPSNVIFVGGQPKLADIGLVTGDGSSRTFVGTEGFIPPEGPGTSQADLYGLGKLLYELATGRDRMDFPQLPPQVSQLPEGEALFELNEVMTRACAPEPKERYATATELQADLNWFLAGRSLRRARNLERHLAQLKRLAAVGCVFLVLAAGALWFVKNEARRANDRARAETTLRQRAETAEQETQQQLHTALLEQARATVRSGELGQRVNALDAVRRAATISNSLALRSVALVALGLPDLRFERELPYDRNYTLRQPDPSFERIALCRDRGPVEIRATPDLRLLATLPASTNLPVYVAEWSADGRFLAVKRDYLPNGTASDKEIWDVSAVHLSTTGEKVAKESQARAEAARRLLLLRDVGYDVMAFHPHLPRLLVADRKSVILWDFEQCTEVNRILINGRPHYAQFAPDGERFAVAYNYRPSAASIVSIHQVADGRLLASNVFANVVAVFDWHQSGGWIAAPDSGGGVHRMDAQTGQTRLLGQHKAQATRVDLSPDGVYLMSGGWDREIICWDSLTLQRAFTASLDGYVGRFRADGQAYALETETGVQLLAFERASGRRKFGEELGAHLGQAAFSPDGRWLAAVGTERLGVWDLQCDSPAALGTNAAGIRVSFAANGELFADRGGFCIRWRTSPGANASSPPKMSPLELAIPKHFTSLSVVSNRAVLTSQRGTAVVGQDELGVEPRNWQPTVEGINGVSPDGRWLAVYRGGAPQLFVHRLPGLERVAILTNASNVAKFQFSPAGDELAVSCRNHVEFWSTTAWQRTRTITNFNTQLYSPDGRTMWLTQEFRAGGLHDARTLELLMPLPSGTIPLAVGPDGRHVAVSVDGRRLQVWDLAEVRQQLRELGLDWAERRDQ